MRKNITRGKGLLENFLSKKRAKTADKLIPDNLRQGRILDIGCGATPYFLLHAKFNQKFGIDPSLENLQNNQNIILRHFDIEQNAELPFEDNFFDVIAILAVFEHIEPEKIPDVLRQIKRTLKPGGRFILTTPCPWSDKLLKFMAKLRLVSPEEINEHKGAYGHKAISLYLEKAGFEKEKMAFGYFEIFLNSWAYADK